MPPIRPFLLVSSRTRAARERLARFEHHHSQNDVVAIPAADASKFRDMLGRASARVDVNENSRMRMRALGERVREETLAGEGIRT